MTKVLFMQLKIFTSIILISEILNTIKHRTTHLLNYVLFVQPVPGRLHEYPEIVIVNKKSWCRTKSWKKSERRTLHGHVHCGPEAEMKE